MNSAAEGACEKCRFSDESRPGGGRLSPGTVWCGKRKMQMAKGRNMSCFSPVGGVKIRHCFECRRAKMMKPTGESPQLGHVWCEKKHAEVNRQRSMECFER